MSGFEIHDLSDEQLVLQYRETQNNEYFAEIYNRYYKKAYHTCLDIMKDRDTAYDLVQDVMIKVMHKLPTLKNGFLLGFWIYRIAQNYSIDYCKDRNHFASMVSEDWLEGADEGADKEALEAREHLLDSLEPALQRLKEADRQLLIRKYLDNHSVEELENEYQLTGSAVKMRLSRARNRMAALYQKEKKFRELRPAM